MIPLPIARLLVAGAVVALISIIALPIAMPKVDLRIESSTNVIGIDERFSVDVMIESTVPVNVFKGEINFSTDTLIVDSISYNTSLADLWAEEPWFSNGDGTLNFIGGTTRPGGFTGKELLLTITFKAIGTGDAAITMSDARVLRHDGFGTDAVVNDPIDAIFTVQSKIDDTETILKKSGEKKQVAITENPPSTDLNGDGKQTIADTSIFMTHLVTQNLRSDFNQDGKVNTTDLSIILNQ